MLARVGEATELFDMIFFEPIKVSARSAGFKRGVEVDQNIRVGDNLPHGLRVGMFLRDVPAGEAVFLKPGDQG